MTDTNEGEKTQTQIAKAIILNSSKIYDLWVKKSLRESNDI